MTMRRSAVSFARDLRSGSITATAAAEAFLAAEAASRDHLHSFVAVDADRLLAEAHQADRDLADGIDRGTLHGVLIGVKDIIDATGYATRCGSPLYPSTPVDGDAEVVKRLRAAGALVAGKTTTHELACGVVSAPTSNPWNTAHIPGGSSGGSGAAVSSGLVPIGLGSDTGGSIRIPAALCGVVGHKPTYGLVPMGGVHPLSRSLDHLGPLGATVADCAVALTAIADGGVDYVLGLGDGVAGLRLGVITDAPFAPMQPDVSTAIDAAVEVLRSLGATCVEVHVPELAHTLAAEFGIIPVEAYEHHRAALRDRGDDIDPAIRSLIVAGAVLPPAVFRRALAARDRITAAIERTVHAERLDALVTPALPATAAAKTATDFDYDGVLEPVAASYVRTTAPFNLTGQPATSVPCGFDRAGLPIGLQIATASGADALALRIAAAYEAATTWSTVAPPDPGIV
jgi:aspartyl-tRNA(Asn)/glutamyl-tRNA(Gln) amidotransferase subunit A